MNNATTAQATAKVRFETGHHQWPAADADEATATAQAAGALKPGAQAAPTEDPQVWEADRESWNGSRTTTRTEEGWTHTVWATERQA